MNWVGGARSRIKIKHEKKIQQEFFEKNRTRNLLRDKQSNKTTPKLSQDLIYLENIKNCCNNATERRGNNIRRVDLTTKNPTKKRTELELPMSPISEEPTLNFQDAKSEMTSQNMLHFKDNCVCFNPRMLKRQVPRQTPNNNNGCTDISSTKIRSQTLFSYPLSTLGSTELDLIKTGSSNGSNKDDNIKSPLMELITDERYPHIQIPAKVKKTGAICDIPFSPFAFLNFPKTENTQNQFSLFSPNLMNNDFQNYSCDDYQQSSFSDQFSFDAKSQCDSISFPSVYPKINSQLQESPSASFQKELRSEAFQITTSPHNIQPMPAPFSESSSLIACENKCSGSTSYDTFLKELNTRYKSPVIKYSPHYPYFIQPPTNLKSKSIKSVSQLSDIHDASIDSAQVSNIFKSQTLVRKADPRLKLLNISETPIDLEEESTVICQKNDNVQPEASPSFSMNHQVSIELVYEIIKEIIEDVVRSESEEIQKNDSKMVDVSVQTSPIICTFCERILNDF